MDVIWDGKDLVWAGDGKTFLRGVGEYFLNHPFFDEAFKKVLKEYRPKQNYKVCLFMVCSYGKPYSQSFIHYKILEALRKIGKTYEAIHQVIVSNVGVVPRELEEYYPFCSYDWNPKFENKPIKKVYSKVLAERLKEYIQTFRDYYENFACYLRWDSDSYRAVRIVEKALKIEIPNLSLPSQKIPKSQIEKVSLGIYDDEDLILVTPKNLRNLCKMLLKIVRRSG